MMEPAEDVKLDDLGISVCRILGSVRRILFDALVWPRSVKIVDVLLHQPAEMVLRKHDHVIEQLSAQTPDEALAVSIGLGRQIRACW